MREAGGKLITTLHAHLSLHTLWINFYSSKPDAFTPVLDADNLLVGNSLLGVIRPRVHPLSFCFNPSLNKISLF